ncbi:MAG: hypothetical protein H6891_06940 [Brucellaceae bacterium]|nr:hypothetical protein [Brucellaceae bacterium]
MSKTSSLAERPATVTSPPLIAAAVLAVVVALALAGWLVYGADIYLTLVDGVLAWCM